MGGGIISVWSRVMFKAFFYFFRECWKLNWKFPFCFIMSELVLAVFTIGNSVLPKFVIDAIFIEANRNQAVTAIVVYILFSLLILLARQFFYSQDFVQTSKTVQKYDLKFASYIARAKYEEIEKQSFLDKKEKAKQFVQGFGEPFGSVLKQGLSIFGMILSMGAMGAIIFTLHPLVLVGLIIITVAQAYLLNKTLKPIKYYQLEQSVVERRRSYFDEKLNDFHYGKEIRNYGLTDWFLKKYREQMKEAFKFYNKMGHSKFKTGCVYVFASVLQLIIAYYYLFQKAFAGNMEVGNFTMYLVAIKIFFTRLSEAISSVIYIQQYKILFESYEEYINLPLEEKHSDFKPELPDNFEVEFQNVSFKYGSSENYALKNINVKFNSKERIAIIGENGAGKSTFIKLLLRLYKPSEGKILINGNDISEINYDYYQSWFASVFQDFKLFAFSIKDNIIFDSQLDENANKRLMEIVEKSGLGENIAKLEKGLDTLIYRDFDEAGFTPSGGVGQKIAIARAAYKNSPVVILDEPTAALDPKAENEIYEQFNDFFSDKLSLYISHRMAVTKFSDRTLVFDNANIIQDGTHEELINQEGKYKELYELQSQYYNEKEE